MYIEHVGIGTKCTKRGRNKTGKRCSIPVSGGSHSTQVSEDQSSCHTNCLCQRRLHFILQPKKTFLTPPPPLFHTHYLKRRTMFQFCQSDCHRGLGTWTTMMGLHGEGMTFHTDGFTGLVYVPFRFLTLGAHAQRGLQYLGLCVCYSQSHFSGVCSSHKGYHLLNGQ